MTRWQKRLLTAVVLIAISLIVGRVAGWLLGWTMLVFSPLGIWLSTTMNRKAIGNTRPFASGLQGFTLTFLAVSVWAPVANLLLNIPLDWISFLAFEVIALGVAVGIAGYVALYVWLISRRRADSSSR